MHLCDGHEALRQCREAGSSALAARAVQRRALQRFRGGIAAQRRRCAAKAAASAHAELRMGQRWLRAWRCAAWDERRVAALASWRALRARDRALGAWCLHAARCRCVRAHTAAPLCMHG